MNSDSHIKEIIDSGLNEALTDTAPAAHHFELSESEKISKIDIILKKLCVRLAWIYATTA